MRTERKSFSRDIEIETKRRQGVTKSCNDQGLQGQRKIPGVPLKRHTTSELGKTTGTGVSRPLRCFQSPPRLRDSTFVPSLPKIPKMPNTGGAWGGAVTESQPHIV